MNSKWPRSYEERNREAPTLHCAFIGWKEYRISFVQDLISFSWGCTLTSGAGRRGVVSEYPLSPLLSVVSFVNHENGLNGAI
jgi:hypothetical protein